MKEWTKFLPIKKRNFERKKGVFKIIIMEDDFQIREELTRFLQNSGYEVEKIFDFENVAENVLKQKPHLVLLDVNLPGQSGYEICTQIRAKSNVPIIFVTSQNNAMDELNGIMLGADDYIEKPYYIPILLARIQRCLNRAYPNENLNKIEYKQMVLDVLKSTISHQEKEIELTKTEFKTLYYLFTNQDKIVPREKIIDYLWDNGVYADDNSLSVIVTRLREKCKQLGIENFIETKRGQGYKI